MLKGWRTTAYSSSQALPPASFSVAPLAPFRFHFILSLIPDASSLRKALEGLKKRRPAEQYLPQLLSAEHIPAVRAVAVAMVQHGSVSDCIKVYQ